MFLCADYPPALPLSPFLETVAAAGDTFRPPRAQALPACCSCACLYLLAGFTYSLLPPYGGSPLCLVGGRRYARRHA